MGTKIRDGGVSYTALDDRYYTKAELNSTIAPSGASLIGVADAGGYFAGTNVEAVLQEIMTVILPGAYLRLDGTNIPTANYNWITNLTTIGTLQGATLTDGTFSITAGVGTGLVSLTDGTASWALSGLSGFGTIQANTSMTASTLTIAGGSITDTTGAISFGNENLTTTGTLGAGATTVTNLTDTGLSVGRVPYVHAVTAGLLIDSANLTYDGTTFSIGTAAGTGANKFFVRGSSYPVSKTERYYDSGVSSTVNVGIFSAYSGQVTTSGWGPTMTFTSNDSTASECGLGQLGFVRDSTAPTYRGKFIVYLSGTGGNYSEAFTIGHTGIITITPREADYDTIINFIGTTNSGVLSWMEDEDYFKFADGILMTSTEEISFNATTEYINSANADYLDLHSTKDTRITCGANYTLLLSPVVWNDINMSLVTAKVPAANFPTWTAFLANLNSYTFAVGDYADIATAEILHDYKEGTDLGLHIHIVTNGLEVGATKAQYTIYYSWGDMNEAMSAQASLTAELTIPANTPDKTHLFLDMGDIAGATYKIGSLLKMRVTRIAKSAGGANPAADPFVEQVGIHYQIDTIGSRQELVK